MSYVAFSPAPAPYYYAPGLVTMSKPAYSPPAKSVGRPAHLLHHRTQSLDLDTSKWPIAPVPSKPLMLDLGYMCISPADAPSPLRSPDSVFADPDLAPPQLQRRGRTIPLPPITPAPAPAPASGLAQYRARALARVRRCSEAISQVSPVGRRVSRYWGCIDLRTQDLAHFAPEHFAHLFASLQGSLYSIQGTLVACADKPSAHVALEKCVGPDGPAPAEC
jgi:hypothetical protein